VKKKCVSEGTVKESEGKKKEAEGQKRKGRPKGSKNKGTKRKRDEEAGEQGNTSEEEVRTAKRRKRRAVEVVVPRRKRETVVVASGSGWQAQQSGEVDRVRDEMRELAEAELEDTAELGDRLQRQAMEELVERMEYEIAAREYVCDQLRRKIEALKRKWE
jgi:hypothetical protein